MKIGFVVNDIETEKAEYTTNRLALAAKEMVTRPGTWGSATSPTSRTAR